VVQLGYYPIDETNEVTRAQCESAKAFCAMTHNRQPATDPFSRLISNDCAARSAQFGEQWIVTFERHCANDQDEIVVAIYEIGCILARCCQGEVVTSFL
jgi:hypothetical protein